MTSAERELVGAWRTKLPACVVILFVFGLSATCVHALDTVTEVPFSYTIDYQLNQHKEKEFWKKFDPVAPDLFHPGSDLRYLSQFGGATMTLDSSYEDHEKAVREYLAYLREKGVKWITPYLCNQTITGNDVKRTGAWEVVDRWEELGNLGLGPKPADLLSWMQREPSGNLHYNYKRMCFLGRGQSADMIRYAPCPNNPDWRKFCNNEARLGAEVGLDGFFIDNCIIHCYCESCETRHQGYLREKYTPQELQEAFGTSDYSELRLYREGDMRYWVRTLPEFIPWLEAKYPPEERRIPFDTTGPLEPTHVDNAGGGTLTGDCQAFLADKVLRPGTQPTFENVRLMNPALQTRVGRLRWAETLMFWGDSIGDMLAEMRDAGRAVNPDYFLMPNWGTMQRVYGAVGRAEDGHDMKRWKKGSNWQMYEEGFTTGIVAPGLVIDYDMELRFAFANGIRAMHLPYRLDGEDVEDVALAETAASGGSVLVDVFNYPETRGKYKEFFQKHPDLYDGYRSAAKVALAYLFDQTYYLNIEHFRQVHALNRYLADQQIPFDHVVEEDFTPEGLSRYRVIILPNTIVLDDRELDAVEAFVKGGGTAIAIGETATYDRRCQRRSADDLKTRYRTTSERGILFKNLSEALPHAGMFFEPAIQVAESFDVLGEQASDKYVNLAELDRKLWFKRYQDPGPLTPLIAKALGRVPHLLDPWEASGVRNTVFTRRTAESQRIVVHLVNKNVPLAVPLEQRNLRPVRDIQLRVPLPSAGRVTTVQCYEPGREERALTWDADSRAAVTVPVDELRAYAVIAIDVKRD